MRFDIVKFDQKLNANRHADLMRKRNRVEQEWIRGRNITILEDEEGVPIVLDTKKLFWGLDKCARSEGKGVNRIRGEIIGVRLASDLWALGKRVRQGVSFTRRMLQAVERVLPQD